QSRQIDNVKISIEIKIRTAFFVEWLFLFLLPLLKIQDSTSNFAQRKNPIFRIIPSNNCIAQITSIFQFIS
ncbi:hypothetical protein V7123_24995, partial [Bacillus toyonensis]|uniref:hypothetical protein n=1 Tax=Bacillus toyonensis TaxID=155322 RepID=UPI002FFFC486